MLVILAEALWVKKGKSISRVSTYPGRTKHCPSMMDVVQSNQMAGWFLCGTVPYSALRTGPCYWKVEPSAQAMVRSAPKSGIPCGWAHG